MLNETLSKLESRIRGLGAVPAEKRAELSALFEDLRQEVSALSKTQADDAETIAQFAAISAREATRPGANAELQRLSRDGLSASVKGFEASHPKLVDTVNSICTVLSNWGI